MDFLYDCGGLQTLNTTLAGGAGSTALQALPKPSQKVTVVKVRPRSSVMLPLDKGGQAAASGQLLKARLPADLFLLSFCCQGPFLMGTYCSAHPALLL